MPTKNLFQSLLNNEVYATGMVKYFPAGTIILDIHSYIKSIPIVLSGSMKVTRTDQDHREILLYYIKPGESCIMSFLAGIHNDTSKIRAIVEEDAEILLIPVNKASDWIKEFPEWTDFIFNLYQKVDARLLHLLKGKADLYHTKELSVTHQQLADELGITREAVSRVLKQMENDKIITLSRNKISLL
jgi:CRP/FNR family transcriptional regulator